MSSMIVMAILVSIFTLYTLFHASNKSIIVPFLLIANILIYGLFCFGFYEINDNEYNKLVQDVKNNIYLKNELEKHLKEKSIVTKFDIIDLYWNANNNKRSYNTKIEKQNRLEMLHNATKIME